MVLKYVISPNPDLLEQMIVKIWEAQSDGPGAEVFTEVIPERNADGDPEVGAGHQVPYVLIANGLDKVVHILRLFDNHGNVLHYYNEEPKVDVTVVFDPIRFTIGDGGPNTPDEGTRTFTHPALEGLAVEDYIIMRNEYGILFEGEDRDYVIDPDSGSFDLIEPDAFDDEEEFVILKRPQVVTTVVNDSVVAKAFGGFVDINVDMDYENSHLRKLLRFSGTHTYTFPEELTIPIGYMFAFQHFGAGAAGSKGTIAFENGPLLWNNTTKSTLDIPLYSEGAFIWDGTNWNVLWLSQTDWVNGAAIQPGQTLAVGRYVLGDVASGNPLYNIVHNRAISGDYVVFLSIEAQSPSTGHRTNKLTYSWAHNPADKPNQFHVWMKEQSGETQAVNIIWMIVKI